jgi:hypothetical protein
VEHSGERESAIRASSASRESAFDAVCVGRLVNVRIARLTSLADVESLGVAVFSAILRAGPDAVLCADVREVPPLTREVASAWSRGMRKTNGHFARAALLLEPSNTILNLQVERVVSCAGDETRRLFTEPMELREWLRVALTNTECDALGALCAGARPERGSRDRPAG